MKHVSTVNHSVEIVLRFVGIWPSSAYAALYWLSCMASLAVVQYFQYSYVYAHFQLSDLSSLMDGLGLTLAYTLAFLKLVALWRNRRVLHDILQTMNREWRECGSNDLYLSIMTDAADLASRFANLVFTVNSSAAFLLTIGEYLYESMSDANRGGNSSRELPIRMKLPFDVGDSPLFECLLVGQFLYEFGVAVASGMVTALLGTLVLHVSGQIDIMRQDLIEISHGKYDSGAFFAIVRDLVYKHQRIIALSESIESLYSYIALLQMLWNTLVICCTGFVIIISIANDQGMVALFKSVGLYIAITLEAFVYCFSGEFLSAKSKSIGDALYESLWYDMQPSHSRLLLFMLFRSQKRLTITAGNIIDLTLEGFTSIMKASVSYISVLNAMY